MLSLPFALVGGMWLMWWLGFNMSVAVAVGFIALAGVAAETGVVMLIYLDNAAKEICERCRQQGRPNAPSEAVACRNRPRFSEVATHSSAYLICTQQRRRSLCDRFQAAGDKGCRGAPAFRLNENFDRHGFISSASNSA